MPQGWTLVEQSDYQANELPIDFCVVDFPGYVAGSSSDFRFHVDASGKAAGELQVDVRLTNSAADAGKQLERLRSMDALTAPARQCFLEDYRFMAAQDVGLDDLLPGSDLTRTTASGSLQGQTVKASVPYRSVAGDKTMYIDDIRLQKGRIVARLVFMTCCQPFDYATVEGPLVSATAKRIQSASTNR